IGEHGSLAVALFDRVTVDGQPVECSEVQRARTLDFVETWYVRHVALDSGRSSTWTSGLGVARMVRAIAAGGGGGLWAAWVTLAGEYGLHQVSLSVPVSLGHGGAERIHEWELTDEQADQLAAAAEFVRDAAAGIEVKYRPARNQRSRSRLGPQPIRHRRRPSRRSPAAQLSPRHATLRPSRWPKRSRWEPITRSMRSWLSASSPLTASFSVPSPACSSQRPKSNWMYPLSSPKEA